MMSAKDLKRALSAECFRVVREYGSTMHGARVIDTVTRVDADTFEVVSRSDGVVRERLFRVTIFQVINGNGIDEKPVAKKGRKKK